MQPNTWTVIFFYTPIVVTWVLVTISFFVTRRQCLASNDPVNSWRTARRRLIWLFVPFLSIVTIILIRIGQDVFTTSP